MTFTKTKSFKYIKNLIIGVGAAVVLMGALFKIESWPFASEMLIAGLSVEALLFLMLGVLGPEPDFYWNKLYPGLDDYDAHLNPLTDGPANKVATAKALDGERVEASLGGMLTELQSMSKSMSSLKALQEVDFSGTKDQLKTMNNFYTQMNDAMSHMTDSVEDVKKYKENIGSLNKNLGSLNSVYGNMLTSMRQQ
jgi:hypothetical protein